MPRRRKNRALEIWMNAERVGEWRIDLRGRHELSYAASWLSSASARPISLSMPLRATPYQGATVVDYFDNLLPERDTVRQRIRSRYGASSTDTFDLLAEVGRDCVGAVQLLPEGSSLSDVKQIKATPLADEQIEELLRGTSIESAGQQGYDDLRISLAGAQLKTALLRHRGRWQRPVGSTPTTHIFKLPIGMTARLGVDLSTSVENEWLCHRLVGELGIPVAPCEMATFGERRALVVERFDRRRSSDRKWIMRLPQEDMCQATGTPSTRKYESDGGPGIERIMAMLLGSRLAQKDRRDFLRAQILFWMLCAIDGHAKNFSLFLEPRGLFRLTPLYDVLSAYPVLGHGRGKYPAEKVKMAMAVSGKNRHYHWQGIDARHWIQTAADCGLPDARAIIEELVESAPIVADRIRGALPKDFPQHVADPILDGFTTSAARLAGQL